MAETKTLADRNVEIGTEIDTLRLLMKNQEFAATYSEYLHPSLFREQLRPIVEVARNYWRQYGKLVPSPALVQELRFKIGTGFTQEKFEATVKTLFQLSSDPVAPKYTEDVISNFIRFQRMENAIGKSIQLLQEADKNRDIKVLDSIPNLVIQASEQLNVSKPTYFMRDLDKRTDRRSELATGEIEYVSFGTGIPEIDELRKPMRGLLAGEIGIWMAATGRGKSIALTHCAMSAFLRGFPVAYFSLELPEDMLLDRADSMATGTQISDIIDERNAVKEFLLDMQSSKQLGDIAFKELPCTGVTSVQLRNELTRMAQQDNFEPRLICVDYLDLMLPIHLTKEGGWKHQQMITQELKALGKDVGAAIYSASQGNRVAAQKNDEGELMGDMDSAESYLKVGVSDWAASINRTKKQMEMPQPQPLWINLVKNRTGIANRKIGILTDYSKMSFYEGVYEENPMEAMQEAAIESGAFDKKKKKKQLN